MCFTPFIALQAYYYLSLFKLYTLSMGFLKIKTLETPLK